MEVGELKESDWTKLWTLSTQLAWILMLIDLTPEILSLKYNTTFTFMQMENGFQRYYEKDGFKLSINELKNFIKKLIKSRIFN